MTLFGLVMTIAVMLGIAVAILLFERRRADDIDRDLKRNPERRSEK